MRPAVNEKPGAPNFPGRPTTSYFPGASQATMPFPPSQPVAGADNSAYLSGTPVRFNSPCMPPPPAQHNPSVQPGLPQQGLPFVGQQVQHPPFPFHPQSQVPRSVYPPPSQGDAPQSPLQSSFHSLNPSVQTVSQGYPYISQANSVPPVPPMQSYPFPSQQRGFRPPPTQAVSMGMNSMGHMQHSSAGPSVGAVQNLVEDFNSLSVGSFPGSNDPDVDSKTLLRPLDDADMEVKSSTELYPFNCHRRYLRVTTNAIPNAQSLLSRWLLPLGAVVHPLAESPDGEEVPTVNLGPFGIVRCRKWRTYVNPYVLFSEGGRKWCCNICNLLNEEYVAKIVDVLGQLLLTDEKGERDAVHKALMSLLRQDAKASLTALFKHIENTEEPIPDDSIREKVLNFIKDKVFPLKAELLTPREEMERHITDLVKKSLQDVTGAEFKMFIDCLKSLSIFGEGAPPERVKELIEIIEGQADLDAQFTVTDVDHIDRLISCLYMAHPFFMRGAPNSKFVNYMNKHILPVFDKLPEERKLDLLKNLAESSPYTSPQDSRQLLPSVVQLVKIYMPRRKTGEEMNFTYVECLLYTFHHLSHKTPNATNSLCGYTIVTGQPSDRIGEDFSENFKDFTERLTNVEELAKTTMKKLTQGLAELTKSINAAATEEEKASIKTKQQNTTTGLRTCNNILAMTKPLHFKAPSFIGDKKINLSWKEAVKPSPTPTTAVTGAKRGPTAINGNNPAHKKGRGEGGARKNNNNQLVNRAFQGVSRGGGSGDGGGRGSGRGRGWVGRGRGRGYY